MIIKYFVILSFLSLFVVNGSLTTPIKWVSNPTSSQFQDASNWDSATVPSVTDDIVIDVPLSNVLLSTTQSINSMLLNSNTSLDITTIGQMTANNITVQNYASLNIDSTTPSQQSFISSSTTKFVNGNLNFQSGLITLNYCNFTNSNLNLYGNLDQTLNSNFILFSKSNLIQNQNSITNIDNLSIISLSTINSTNSKLIINNNGFTSTMTSTNINLNGSLFKADNYFILGNTKINLKNGSMFSIGSVSLMVNPMLIVDSSTFSFDNNFYCISSSQPIFKNNSTFKSTSSSAQAVISFNSSMYFENSIFDLQGPIIVSNDASLIFSNQIKPLNPIQITCRDNSKLSFLTLNNNGVGISNLLSPFNTTILKQSIINLEGYSTIQLENIILNSLIINSINQSSIQFGNNIYLSNSLINNNNNQSLSIDSNLILLNSTLNSINRPIVLSGIMTVVGNGSYVNGDINVIGNGNMGSNQSINRLTVNGSVSGTSNTSIYIRIESPSNYTQFNISNQFADFNGTIIIELSSLAAKIANQPYPVVFYNNSRNSITFTTSNSGSTTYIIKNGGKTDTGSSSSSTLSRTNVIIICVIGAFVVVSSLAAVIYVQIRNHRHRHGSRLETTTTNMRNSNSNIKLEQIK